MGAASLRPSAPFEVPRTPFGVRDPLRQLSFPLPTGAVPRKRPFSRGSLTGALGQNPTLVRLPESGPCSNFPGIDRLERPDLR